MSVATRFLLTGVALTIGAASPVYGAESSQQGSDGEESPAMQAMSSVSGEEVMGQYNVSMTDPAESYNGLTDKDLSLSTESVVNPLEERLNQIKANNERNRNRIDSNTAEINSNTNAIADNADELAANAREIDNLEGRMGNLDARVDEVTSMRPKRGKKGPTGDRGPQGPKGPDGDDA